MKFFINVPTCLASVFDDSPDNFWVITGSRETKSSAKNISGFRSMTGHFEEYIRWIACMGKVVTCQRYVINTSKSGLTLAQLNEDFQSCISAYKPKAVAVMIDKNDFDTNVEDLKSQAKKLIESIFSIYAVPVFLTPAKSLNDDTNSKIQKIVDTLNEICSHENYEHKMIVVNLFDLDITGMLNENDSLNYKGQLMAAKKMVKDLTGDEYVLDNFAAEKEVFNPIKSKIKFDFHQKDKAITIKIPHEFSDLKDYEYQLETEEAIITKKFATNEIEIKDVPNKSKFNLKVKVNFANGEQIYLNELIGSFDGKIKFLNNTSTTDLLSGIKNPKIMFVGDSITHGAFHTFGYDSVPQLFEKALVDVGYVDSVVINTAVSGAKASKDEKGTLNEKHKKYRLDAFLYPKNPADKPNIVIVMLGTNDANEANMTEDEFENNIREIVKIIKEAGATPVLRTLPLVNKQRKRIYKNIFKFARRINELADEENCIVVDHTQLWHQIYKSQPSLLNTISGSGFLNDLIHPNANGQLLMFRQLFELVCGSENYAKCSVSKIAYEINPSRKKSKMNLRRFIKKSDDKLILNSKLLKALCFKNITNIDFFAETDDGITHVKTKSKSKSKIELSLKKGKTYKINAICDYSKKFNSYELIFNDIEIEI